MTATAVVIGAGVGGLAAAIHLARAGLKVRLLERAARVGGKLCQVEVAGQKFDAGPSVLTMPWVFEELLGKGELDLVPVEPLCRHFFADGSVLDLHTDEERSRAAIERLAGPASARGYLAFRRHAAAIYDLVRGPFIEQPLPSLLDWLSPQALLKLGRIDAMRPLWKALEHYFPDPRLRQLFGRYATYNGSSPFHAPATLAVIAHVELAYGIFTVRGGLYRLAEALEARARALGVEIATATEVEEVLLEERPAGLRAAGVQLAGGLRESADVVVANCEATYLYERLLGHVALGRKLGARYRDAEPSLSAYLLLAVAERAPLELAHHNVFFSADYRREFDELVSERQAPQEPTVYLCAQDRAAGNPPVEAERCFFLTNAPPVSARRLDWKLEAGRCRSRIERVLERHGWQLAVRASADITPADFERSFPSSGGALYGAASNSRMAAFRRAANRAPGVSRLYLAGGSAHPGAGLPMVALSGKIAAQLALADLKR